MTSVKKSQPFVFVDKLGFLPTIGNKMAERHMSNRERALALVRARGIARARDFTAAGIPLAYLKRMTDAGELERLGRGLYQDPERVGEDIAHNLAEAARLAPTGVISLISALRHHNLTTQLPHAVWMTIPHKARAPKADWLRLEIVRATGPALTEGIEHINVEGVNVPIYNVPKTIADCFKHRTQVGEDVAIEALKDALRERKTTISEIMRFAKIDRVANLIGPYVLALQ
jgi:predicted transcriptional regulator of viral defense system